MRLPTATLFQLFIGPYFSFFQSRKTCSTVTGDRPLTNNSSALKLAARLEDGAIDEKEESVGFDCDCFTGLCGVALELLVG
jgi:hypothetical protein